jgi:formylglycine-generating enzyme required for sulfatase activity
MKNAMGDSMMANCPKTRTAILGFTMALVVAISVGAADAGAKPAQAQGLENNGGVLNGPLTDRNLGFKATGEGTADSLRLAIKDLMKTYGRKYPKGADFLTRLDAGEDLNTLKREALLLENPAIDFDKLLMVRASRNGKRYSANWQTRASCNSETRAFTWKDMEEVLSSLKAKDKTLPGLFSARSNAEMADAAALKTLRNTEAYKNEKDAAKRTAMEAATPEHVKFVEADKALKDTASKYPEYLDACKKLEEKCPVPNYEDALVVMPIKGNGETETVYKPKSGKFVGDVDLHFDGDKVLFTSFIDQSKLNKNSGRGKGYGVFELEIDPQSGQTRGEPKQISPDTDGDIDCFDACYLPEVDQIIYASTAAYEGVPCVGGGDYVANLYRIKKDGSQARRLTFDQDGNWHPSVMENGRILYTRWEYTDSAHYFSRIMMTMNPDGTDQKAFYGSNSYWPNSMFFARQLPGQPSMFVSTIAGHHSNPKGGPLCIFDVSKGTQEADGAVQFLTGRGKQVQPLVIDALSGAYGTMYYNPFPITDKFFLATTGNGEVYLMDIYDNVICLKKGDKDGNYFEPMPLRKTAKPEVTTSRVNPASTEATVLINDIYFGPGLRDVPRGTVKSLRVYRYEYGPRHKGGHYSMGMEAGWDAKQVLGIATVDADGSASFNVPANTPFAMQPLDADGKALQLMRSWTVAMPGEKLTCIGCHENANMTPPVKRFSAMNRQPESLKPFYGPTRGFSFQREVQPVLDKYCVGCHDGQPAAGRYVASDRIIGTGKNTGKTFAECGIPNFTIPREAHTLLHPYVRRNGPEGDYHLLTSLEFHADTSELFQMLDKGHHNVQLDKESLDHLITWADLNAPYHGTWTEAGASKEVLDRRKELRLKYAGVSYDPEVIVNPYTKTNAIVMPKPLEQKSVQAEASTVDAQRAESIEIDLGNDVKMKLVGIPSGEFSMGSNSETPVEQPVCRVKIEKPFLMGATEVTLKQYRQFDPQYLNGVYDMHYKDQVHRGYYMNDMDFPVIRVPWAKAVEFCAWLSKTTGKKVTLPTEAQWEWACRSGSTTPLSYGDLNTEFSKEANLADITVKQMAVSGVNPKPIANPNPDIDFELKDPRSNDAILHLAKVGSFKPNAWGLFDMHGNAAEWTRSDYKPYPYTADDGRNSGGPEKKVVRGGSWHDRPFRSTSSFRLGFTAWQPVYHTGFRVIIE